MDETTLTIGLVVLAILISLWSVCRRDTNGSAGRRTGRNSDPVRDNLDSAERENNALGAAERTTAERLTDQAATIRRTAEDNQRGQELVQKARDILANAQHTD